MARSVDPSLSLDGDLRLLEKWTDVRVREVAVSPDGRWAILDTGAPGGTVRLLPLGGGEIRAAPFKTRSIQVGFAPDGIAFVDGDTDRGRENVLWNVESNAVLHRHPATYSLAHGEKTFLAYRGGEGPAIERWTRGGASPDVVIHLRPGREILHDPDKTGDEAFWEVDRWESAVSATMKANGRVITSHCAVVAGSQKSAVYEWNVGTETARALGTLDTLFGPGDELLFLPGVRRAIVHKYWGERWLALWDLETGAVLWRVELEHMSSAIALDAFGRWIALASAEGHVEIRAVEDGRLAGGARIVPHRFLGVSAFAFTPDGRLLMAIADGELLAMLELPW